ncbi:hypothetical protein PG995_012455 [Apiospora arundinis]
MALIAATPLDPDFTFLVPEGEKWKMRNGLFGPPRRVCHVKPALKFHKPPSACPHGPWASRKMHMYDRSQGSYPVAIDTPRYLDDDGRYRHSGGCSRTARSAASSWCTARRRGGAGFGFRKSLQGSCSSCHCYPVVASEQPTLRDISTTRASDGTGMRFYEMDGLGLPAGMRVVALGALLAKRTFRPSGPKCENRTRRPGRLPECPGAVPRAPGAWKTLRRAPASLRRRGTLVRISQLPGSGHTLARISAAAVGLRGPPRRALPPEMPLGTGKGRTVPGGRIMHSRYRVAAATSLRDISPARAPRAPAD